MKKVSRKQINEVISLIKEVQQLTGKKVLFKENIENILAQIVMAVHNVKRNLQILQVNPELKYGGTIYKNLNAIQNIAHNVIQNQKKKSVSENKKLVKEANGEAEGNKIVTELQQLIHAVSELKGHLNTIPVSKKYAHNLTRSLKIVEIMQERINKLIQDETQHEDDTTTIPIEEDVDMDIDQIMQEPDVVQKLNQKKLNINLVDKNNRNTSSNSTSSTTTSY